MKKVLFATTALVASAGIASAQGVTLSGSAEMGIMGGSGLTAGPTLGATTVRTQFHHDIDIKFTLSGETDNGLTFGATIDLDEVVAAGPGIAATANPSSVFLSGNFGTITMGDTDGALDWALQDLDILGDISDANTSHVGFNGNSALDPLYDGQVARYDYSFGDFAFAVSAELDDTGVGDPVFGIGGKYNADLAGVTVGVGLGYQSNGTTDIIGVSLDATHSSGIRGVFNYTDYNGAVLQATPLSNMTIAQAAASVIPVDNHIAAGLFYTMDALSVGVHYGVYSFETAAVADRSGVGLVANYDLGGGAVVQFGYSHSTAQSREPGFALGDKVTADTFSLGVAMSF